MTDSFGARLRRERERRSIDLSQVAARTKIKASLFEALERNDVSQWPAGLFRRSFIRAYADAVGLDAQATLVEFCQHFPDPADPLSDRPSEGKAKPPRPLPFAPAAASAAPVVQASEPLQAEPRAAGSTELAEALRLTLAEADLPFQVNRVLAGPRTRWQAVACDIGIVFAVALVVFIVANRFWMPLGITALSYYVGGILFLGNSPGIRLFATQGRADELPPSEPVRPLRPRHADLGRGRTVPVLPREAFRAPRRARTSRT